MIFFVIRLTVMQHIVPSPRELAMRAQTIMQNALIKKKLEEHRNKRQDQQQQQQQQQQQAQQRTASPVNSPTKQIMSPTPLAFTPTSVLRKMTADKEPEGANQSNHQLESAFLYSSSINENRNNYRNANQCRNSTDSRMSISPDNTIQLFTNHNVKEHGTVAEIIPSHSNPLRELNNNFNVEVEESALKTKYLSLLQQSKDTNNNLNSNNSISRDTLTVETVKLLIENTPTKMSTMIDISDANNNSPLILDKLLAEQFEFETIIVENNKMIGKMEEKEIQNLENDEVFT